MHLPPDCFPLKQQGRRVGTSLNASDASTLEANPFLTSDRFRLHLKHKHLIVPGLLGAGGFFEKHSYFAEMHQSQADTSTAI
jgi:hypothetical protein